MTILACHTDGEIILRFCLILLRFGFLGWVEEVMIWIGMIFTAKRRPLWRTLSDNSRSWNLIDPQLANGLRIETLTHGDRHAFTLRSNKVAFRQFYHSSHIFVPLFSEQLNNKFQMFLIWLVLEGNLLIEDELSGSGGRNFWCYCLPLMFQVEPAGKLNF